MERGGDDGMIIIIHWIGNLVSGKLIQKVGPDQSRFAVLLNRVRERKLVSMNVPTHFLKMCGGRL